MAKNKSHDKENAGHHGGDHHHDDHDEDHGAHKYAEHHEEGEPWLVSYADMMTLLFGFFVVMYSFAAKDPRAEECVRMKLKEVFQKDEVTTVDAKQESKDSIAFKAIQMLMATLNVESIEDVVEKLEENDKKSEETSSSSSSKEKKETMTVDDLKALMAADEIKNTISISIPVDIVFVPGSPALLPASTPKLNQLLMALREIRGVQSISVIGHTDASPPPSGAKTDNWSLSVMRASEVAKFMMNAGIDPRLLRVEGRGNGDPLLPEKGNDGKPLIENMAKNRRIEIMVVKDKSNVKI